MREITVRCQWSSVHTLEVPDDTPRIASDDLNTAIEASGDDVYSNVAELVNWEVEDRG